MPHSNTPFRVFIFRREKTDKLDVPVTALQPAWETGLREHPHMLSVPSEDDLFTRDVFDYIMKEFRIWWTTTRLGPYCYLISNNLSIHRSEQLAGNALACGIQRLIIMPGFSHWFQVHDQLPSGTLKKKMNDKKFDFLNDISPTSSESRILLMGLLYEVNSFASNIKIVAKSFADVGSWPWNSGKKMKASEEHTPATAQLYNSETVIRLVIVIHTHSVRQEDRRHQTVRGLKPVEIISIQTPQKQKRHRKDVQKNPVDGKKQQQAGMIRKKEYNCMEPPKKHLPKPPSDPKKCCARRYQKVHFRSKK